MIRKKNVLILEVNFQLNAIIIFIIKDQSSPLLLFSLLMISKNNVLILEVNFQLNANLLGN